MFVHQDEADGGAIVVTGENGLLGQARRRREPGSDPRAGPARRAAGRTARRSTLTFDNLSWPVVTDAEAGFRPRGRDQRELTLRRALDLAGERHRASPSAAEIAAELHARLVLIATVPLLPLLAAPLALAGGQRRQRSGIVIGLLILVVYYEALSFGEALAKRELLAPWLGLWLPFAGAGRAAPAGCSCAR